MGEKPLKGILDRSESESNATKHFAEQTALLSDLANYGSNLIMRAFNSSERGLADVVACGVLLKQVVAMIDATSTLVASGDAHAAQLTARAAFEASIYLDWILFSDTQAKATAYVVSNYREERLWANRAIHGTSEEEVFSTLAKSVGLDIHARHPSLSEAAVQQLARVNQVLSQPEFADVDKKFTAAKGRRKYDVDWTAVCGAKSIRHIAEQVGRLAEYEFFYSRGSQVTHSARFKDHVTFEPNQVHFIPIRNLRDIDSLLNFVVSTAMRAYQHTLAYFRPRELPAFARKYSADWRMPFLTVKKVNYQYQEKLKP